MKDNSETTEEESYVLPSWRVNQIILIAVRFLTDEGYYEDGFDYQKAIQNKGILLKAYSAFKSENLLELQKISLSLWKEGLCLVATDSETQQVCRMIAYNDSKTAAEIMQIIFHEYGHILFWTHGTMPERRGRSNSVFCNSNVPYDSGTAVPHRAAGCKRWRRRTLL